MIDAAPRAWAWLLAGKPARPLPLARDGAMLVGGLFVFALAQALSLRCNLGAASWTVLHDGLARQTPLSIGQATQLAGLLMGGVAWLAGVRPGLGTLANMLLIGWFLDLILWADVIPEADAYPARVAMLLAGIVVMGAASALYIKAGFGAGPRDSFMLALMRATGARVGLVRWGMEVTAALVGILLGGRFGPGTIVFAMLVGVSVDVWFRVLRVREGRGMRRAEGRGLRAEGSSEFRVPSPLGSDTKPAPPNSALSPQPSALSCVPPHAYHLTPEPWYRAQPGEGPYVPEGFEREGFVHLTHGLDEVVAVGNRYYRADPRPYLLLTVALDRLSAEVRYDDPDRRFPHVYGPVDRAAIVGEAVVRRADDGRFEGVDGREMGQGDA